MCSSRCRPAGRTLAGRSTSACWDAPKDFRPQRKAHPGILVTDLDALAARLERHGSPVAWDDGFPGMRRFYTEDAFGNRLEFLQPRP